MSELTNTLTGGVLTLTAVAATQLFTLWKERFQSENKRRKDQRDISAELNVKLRAAAADARGKTTAGRVTHYTLSPFSLEQISGDLRCLTVDLQKEVYELISRHAVLNSRLADLKKNRSSSDEKLITELLTAFNLDATMLAQDFAELNAKSSTIPYKVSRTFTLTVLLFAGATLVWEFTYPYFNASLQQDINDGQRWAKCTMVSRNQPSGLFQTRHHVLECRGAYEVVVASQYERSIQKWKQLQGPAPRDVIPAPSPDSLNR